MRIFCIAICLISFQLSAQNKVEIEKRINDKEVPQSAIEVIEENIKTKSKVKWYFQKDADKEVFEAKFKQHGKDFSVEFLTSGMLYNVEILLSEKSLNRKLLKSIKASMDELFDDYKILKIQVEYIGEDDDLEEIIEDYDVDDDLEQRFEIEVNAKNKGKRELFEMIFSQDGVLLSKRIIVVKSSDILDY